MKKYKLFKEHGNKLLELPEIKEPKVNDFTSNDAYGNVQFDGASYQDRWTAHNAWLSSGIQVLEKDRQFFEGRDVDESEFEVRYKVGNVNEVIDNHNAAVDWVPVAVPIHTLTEKEREIIINPASNPDETSVASHSCTAPTRIEQKLTPELLLQLGFKQGDDNSMNKHFYAVKHIAINPYNGVCFISEDNFRYTAKEMAIPREIFYLHELEEVYKAFTGESLLNHSPEQ